MKGVQVLCFSRTNIFQRKVEGMGKIKGFYVYSKRIFFGGGMSHSSTHSYPRHYVEMHGKLYPPATLPSGKKFLLPNDWEAKYFLVPVRVFIEQGKISFSWREPNTHPRQSRNWQTFSSAVPK